VKNSSPWTMRYSPTIHPNRSGKAMTSMPKMIATRARMGFEMVTPNFFSPFSIVSLIIFHSVSF